MSNLQPDPRFNDYEEVVNGKGIPVGFKLKNCEFFFKYDSNGGWKDEKGNQYD